MWYRPHRFRQPVLPDPIRPSSRQMQEYLSSYFCVCQWWHPLGGPRSISVVRFGCHIAGRDEVAAETPPDRGLTHSVPPESIQRHPFFGTHGGQYVITASEPALRSSKVFKHPRGQERRSLGFDGVGSENPGGKPAIEVSLGCGLRPVQMHLPQPDLPFL